MDLTDIQDPSFLKDLDQRQLKAGCSRFGSI